MQGPGRSHVTLHAILQYFIALQLATVCVTASGRAGPASTAAAAAQSLPHQPYSFQPLSPHAVLSVAIIGTAKAGTTDLYTLLTRTSHLAPGLERTRMKEAKLLIEAGRTLKPGHPDFAEYLRRIGHPCATSKQQQQQQQQEEAADTFQQCMQQLSTGNGSGISAGSSDSTGSSTDSLEAKAFSSSSSSSRNNISSSSKNNSSSSQLALSIDATPIYLSLPQAVTALRAISNDTKIIILLRHPVDRAESLYNHRVNTERNHHLPARVMSHTINEWAHKFIDWVENTPAVKPLLASLAQEHDTVKQAQVYQQLVDLNILGLPDDLPLTFANYNRHGHIERNIFGTALYAGSLAPWRAGYLRPGRVMVVDSHAFFAQRLSVMNEVYMFVHGRPMSEAGRHIAQRTAVQNARRSRGIEFVGSRLDTAAKQRIADFYQPHVGALLQHTLPAMEREGALVVGFEGPPWVSVQQH